MFDNVKQMFYNNLTLESEMGGKMEKIIIPQKITFEEAERICEKRGMTLICVSYIDEQTIITAVEQ